MSIYLRARAQLRAAGIEHLDVNKGLFGPYLIDDRYDHQRSRCHTTWQDAVRAAIAGERPERVEEKGEGK